MVERLAFELSCQGKPAPHAPPVVVGVVASGNLEVLVEPVDLPGQVRFEVSTSAQGFEAIWQAVLRDFADRHGVTGLAFSLNDAGATPAVVSLRLDQAIEAYLDPAR
jgi:malonate decarboxylase delta subunit